MRLPLHRQRNAAASLRRVLGCALAASLLLVGAPMEAARKYYPSDSPQPGADKPAERVVERVLPGSVVVKKVYVPKPVRRRDALLSLMDEQQYYQALRLVEERLKQSPRDQNLKLIKAQLLRLDGNYQQAEQEYKAIIEAPASRALQAKGWSGLGMVRLSQANDAKSLSDMRLASAYFEEATTYLNRSLAITPSLMESWVAKGIVALLNHQLDEAEKALKKATAIQPNDILLLLAKGNLALEQGEAEEALALAYRAKKEAPDDQRILLLMGKASMALGRYDDAIIQFKQLIERAPDNSDALRQLALAYQNKERYTDAVTTLEKAVYTNPTDAAALQPLLVLYDQDGARDRAILLLRTLIDQLGQRNTIEALSARLGITAGVQNYRMSLQQALAERLLYARDWPGAMELAQNLLAVCQHLESPTTAKSEISPEDLAFCRNTDRLTSILYAESALLSGHGRLYHERFRQTPHTQAAIKDLEEAVKASPGDWRAYLGLVMLDPLYPLPETASIQWQTLNNEQQIWLVQLAFLATRHDLYEMLMTHMLSPSGQGAVDAVSLDRLDRMMFLAERLIDLGDLDGAQRILDWEKTTLQALGGALSKELSTQYQRQWSDLDRTLGAIRQDLPGRYKILETLRKTGTSGYWEDVATRTLQMAPADPKLRGLIADSLLRQRQYVDALFHQKMAARLLPQDNRERQRWLKQVAKTEALLKRQQAENAPAGDKKPQAKPRGLFGRSTP